MSAEYLASLSTSVHSALETFATIALYKLTYTTAYHSITVPLNCGTKDSLA